MCCVCVCVWQVVPAFEASGAEAKLFDGPPDKVCGAVRCCGVCCRMVW
jgi:hypothetical protein